MIQVVWFVYMFLLSFPGKKYGKKAKFKPFEVYRVPRENLGWG
jgi:hypothetical protein